MSFSLRVTAGTQPARDNVILDLDQLWSGVRNSEKKALSQLFSASYSWLFKYGYRIIPSKSLVRDGIQELFFVLWNKRDTINQARSVKSYLISSLKRILMRGIKKQKNRSERNYIYIENQSDTTESIEDSIIGDESRNNQNHRLQMAMDALSTRQQKAIRLKFYRGLSTNEIAEVMSINKQSVYNHISEAMATMQNVLER